MKNIFAGDSFPSYSSTDMDSDQTQEKRGRTI